MAQALLNLLNNAVKYSSASKHIDVRAYELAGNVFVEVADQGIGIPRSEQKKIFEKFYRVSDGLVHDTKGSGLGLSIVKHIVEAHGGQISVDSQVGKGSRFIISMPIKQIDSDRLSTKATLAKQSKSKDVYTANKDYDIAQDFNH